MFERLERLYREGQIQEKHLLNAIRKGLITEQEKNIIMQNNPR